MKRYLLYFILLIGTVSLFSCEKDETKLNMASTPTAPTLTAIPALVLKRVDAKTMVVIAGTKADFGFPASVSYDLEAALAGTNFADPISIASAYVDTFALTEADLNTKLITKLPQDLTSNVEFRVRANLTVEGPPTKINVLSAVVATSITTYGPSALLLTVAGKLQTIVSATDNKIYKGWIYSDGTPFTLKSKDDNTVYGGSLGNLVAGGAAITIPAGAYNLTVDLSTATKTLAMVDVTIGMIGDAINGWGDTNDLRMTWDFTDNTWNAANVAVKAGGIKFRTVGGWSSINVAYDPAAPDLNKLYQSHANGGPDSGNITDIPVGNYNVKFWLTPVYKAKFTKI